VVVEQLAEQRGSDRSGPTEDDRGAFAGHGGRNDTRAPPVSHQATSETAAVAARVTSERPAARIARQSAGATRGTDLAARGNEPSQGDAQMKNTIRSAVVAFFLASGFLAGCEGEPAHPPAPDDTTAVTGALANTGGSLSWYCSEDGSCTCSGGTL